MLTEADGIHIPLSESSFTQLRLTTNLNWIVFQLVISNEAYDPCTLLRKDAIVRSPRISDQEMSVPMPLSVPPEVAESIRAKRHRYGRYIDAKQCDTLAEVALPDTQLTFLGPSGAISKIGTTMAFSSIKDFS